MKVITPGHLYELAHFPIGMPGYGVEKLQFIQTLPADDGSTEPRTYIDGTTNEEVLKVLIDRMQFLNAKFPCRENALAITKLEEALFWLNKRTADRVSRGVEGKHVA